MVEVFVWLFKTNLAVAEERHHSSQSELGNQTQSDTESPDRNKYLICDSELQGTVMSEDICS